MAKALRPRMNRPAAVSELLSTLFAGTPAADRLKEGAIWEIWSNTVGPQIASRARPSAIRNGTLTVTVSSSPWLQQLNFMKSQIREKINDALGEEMVKEIYLKAGSIKDDTEVSAVKPARKKAPRNLTPDEINEIAQATGDIADPELRTTLASLFTTHLTNRRT